MMDANPFRPTRFEHAERPLIWLSPRLKLLEGLKSIYLAGTRGSGKTSLLKAINWRERLYNQTLIDQIEEGQPANYIAIYFRFPDYVTSALARIDWRTWFPKSPDPDAIEQDVFGKMIEIISSQLFCEAVCDMRAASNLDYSPRQETDLAKRISDKYPNMNFRLDQHAGLDALAASFREIQRRLNRALTRGSVSDLDQDLPLGEPGTFLNEVVSELRALVCSDDSSQFHFKVCIDDCETLVRSQQRILNTLVRISKNPLFWIISFVSNDYDSTSTLIPNQSLTNADRSYIDLNSESETDFRKLCQEVSSLRLYYSLPEAFKGKGYKDLSKPVFRLQAIFGHCPTNALIFDAMKGSLSNDFQELVTRAETLAPVLKGQTVSKRDVFPPVWQTYVMERLGLVASKGIELVVNQRARQNFEAYLRRKQRAALLTFCSEFRIGNVPYSGENTIIAMSDLCVRDYLEIAAAIVDKALENAELASIAALVVRDHALSLQVQREGIYRASAEKFDGIKNSAERDWVEVSKLVECLGKLTSKLQSDHTRPDSLATPERGIFVFDFGAISGRDRAEIALKREAVSRILQRCVSDGLIRSDVSRQSARKAVRKAEADRPKALSYRLHRRFSSFFGFSARGPYEPVAVPMDDFAELCQNARKTEADQWVAKVYDKISLSSDRQTTLSLSETYE